MRRRLALRASTGSGDSETLRTSPAQLRLEINVRMLARDRLIAPSLDRAIDLLFRSDTVDGDARVPHNASVMSSTRRTDTPARYIISIRASSTKLSRRR
jgi:hypothetical protein